MSTMYPSSLPSPRMTSFDTYNAKTTSISYPWPSEVTGIERIALSAQGDLQRVLSAFFSRPIVIALVYSHTLRQASPNSAPEPLTLPNAQAVASASPTCPITQTRQVHLQCGGKIACTATSIVRITSAEVAHLFLEEKYAIGQMFRRMEKVPAFELLSVGIGLVNDDEKARSYGPRNQLWRKYKLVIPDFECEILEVFPDRTMFTNDEGWLNGDLLEDHSEKEMGINLTIRLSRSQQGFALIFMMTCFLVLGIEGVLLFSGRPINCQHDQTCAI